MRDVYCDNCRHWCEVVVDHEDELVLSKCCDDCTYWLTMTNWGHYTYRDYKEDTQLDHAESGGNDDG